MRAIETSSWPDASRELDGSRGGPAALDTVHAVETPEGCVLALRVAGPFARARAWLVDLGIRLFLYLVGGTVLGTLDALGAGLAMLLVFGLEWGYPVAFEIWRDGQTPGKRLCGLAVVHVDGTPVQARAAIVRNVLRAVDFLPVGYMVGLVTMVVAGAGRRLGDLAAGTLVVHTDGHRDVDARAWDEAGAEPLPVALTTRERRAVVDFALRARRLSPARAEELARTATPLTRDAPDGQAAARLARLANTIVGRG